MGESDSGVIVVADDDVDILDLVSLTLERAGLVAGAHEYVRKPFPLELQDRVAALVRGRPS